MRQTDPYQIIKNRRVTEKAVVLQQLHASDANPSLSRCETPKYVFNVDVSANKRQIAEALEEIYRDKNIKVLAVNTVNVKRRPRRVRGHRGFKAGFKKAIVTLSKGDNLDEV